MTDSGDDGREEALAYISGASMAQVQERYARLKVRTSRLRELGAIRARAQYVAGDRVKFLHSKQGIYIHGTLKVLKIKKCEVVTDEGVTWTLPMAMLEDE